MIQCRCQTICIFVNIALFLFIGKLCFFDVLLDNPVLVKTRLLIREYGKAMLTSRLFGDNWSPAFFGALTSVGALLNKEILL